MADTSNSLAAADLADEVKRTMELLFELQVSLYAIQPLPFINVRKDFKEKCEVLHGYVQKCRDFGADVFTLEVAVGHESKEELIDFLHEMEARANELQQNFRKLRSDGMSGAFLKEATMDTSDRSKLAFTEGIQNQNPKAFVAVFVHPDEQGSLLEIRESLFRMESRLDILFQFWTETSKWCSSFIEELASKEFIKTSAALNSLALNWIIYQEALGMATVSIVSLTSQPPLNKVDILSLKNIPDFGQAITELADDLEGIMVSLQRLESSPHGKAASHFSNLHKNLNGQWEMLYGYLQRCHRFGGDLFRMHFIMEKQPKESSMKILQDIKAHSNELRAISEELRSSDISEGFLKAAKSSRSAESNFASAQEITNDNLKAFVIAFAYPNNHDSIPEIDKALQRIKFHTATIFQFWDETSKLHGLLIEEFEFKGTVMANMDSIISNWMGYQKAIQKAASSIPSFASHSTSQFDMAVIETLLEQHGVKMELNANESWKALLWAAGNGNEELVYRLLTEGCTSVNAEDKSGQTPLLCAVSNGHEQIVRMLIKQKGADVNLKTKNGWSPLFQAASKGHDAIARLLLENKDVDVNIKTKNGWTPLLQAAWKGHDEVVRLLLEQKSVEVNVKVNNSINLLMCAASNGHEAVVRLLLAEKDTDVNFSDQYGWTPLLYAASKGHEAIVRLLLEQKGVDVNIKVHDGVTPLICAAAGGHEAVVRLLLKQINVDVNIEDDDGWTALMHAVSKEHEVVACHLLGQKGVNVTIKDKDGWSLLMHAASNGREARVRLLLARNDVDTNIKDKNGWTPLTHGASNGYEAIVRLLLQQKGTTVDTKAKDGVTPLICAAANGYERIVRLLIEEKGAEVDAKDNDGWTPLMHATSHKHGVVVRLLLEHEGVNVNSRDNEGWSPLLYAASRGYEEIVRVLLEQKGVDINAKAMNGATPLSEAERNRHESTVLLLLASRDIYKTRKRGWGWNK